MGNRRALFASIYLFTADLGCPVDDPVLLLDPLDEAGFLKFLQVIGEVGIGYGGDLLDKADAHRLL